MPINDHQFFGVFDIFGNVFFLCYFESEAFEQHFECIFFSLFEVISENQVSFLAEMIPAIVYQLQQVYFLISEIVDFAFEVEQ